MTLSAASSSTVTASFATANGTATAGIDYVAQTGNLSFTAGQTSKTISVTVNGDTTVEPQRDLPRQPLEPLRRHRRRRSGSGRHHERRLPSPEAVGTTQLVGPLVSVS